MEIELSDAALTILKRHSDKYHVLPKISSQRFNEYIKECCKIAGINTPTTYKDFTGGLVTEKIAPKYELVGSHTARKTFITNFYRVTTELIERVRSGNWNPVTNETDRNERNAMAARGYYLAFQEVKKRCHYATNQAK